MREVTEKRGEDVRKDPAGYPLEEKKKNLLARVSKYSIKKQGFLKTKQIVFCLR